MEDRTEEIREIIEKIDQYLEGQLSISDVSYWGHIKLTEDPIQPEPPTEHDLLVWDGWGSLMLLSESEPEEFRTRQEELIQIRSYLTGEEDFPYEERLRLRKSHKGGITPQ